MNYVTLALNILFFVFLGVGLLNGFTRGLKRTLVRSIWIIFIICLLIPLSLNITSWILKINFPLSYGGQACANINEYLLAMFKDLLPVTGGNYAGLVDICMFLVSLLLNGIIFLLCYWILKLVSLPLYWILNAFIFAGERKKKKRAKREKEKVKIKKYRLAGAGVGLVLGLISFCMTMTPIVGYVNLVKVFEKETANEGGSGVLSENVGDVYNDAIKAYDSSIPISLLNSVGADNLLLSVFDGITTSKIGNKRIVLKDEVVSFSKIYNEVKDVNLPDLQTATQAELNDALTDYENIVEAVFDSQLISATSDVIIPFGVAYARENIKTDNFKPYVLSFYNSLFDEMENLNSSTTKHEINSILGLLKTLNDSNLLLPIIQTPNDLGVEYLKDCLTKEVSDQIVEKLFSITTVNNVAPALVNFLLGFGAEQLDYDYTSENVVTSEALKQSVSVLMNSVVDLLQNYNAESSTQIELNETSVGAFGGMLDEVKRILSTENFSSVVNALEPKLEQIALDALSGQPQFLIDTVKEVVGNISDIDSYKTSLLNVYDAIKEVEKRFEDAKVGDSYDVQYMDFIKIGGAIDDIQNSGLFKNDLVLKTIKGAIENYSAEIAKSLTEDDSFNFTFDTQLIANIDELNTEEFTWESELPKYKNTFGIFINLFQNEGDLFEKLKSDSDATLEELGYEFDHDLKDSALFKNVDRPLVADLLTLSNKMINSSDDEGLATLLEEAKENVLNESVAIDWEDEFFHIKQLLKLEFDDVSDDSLLQIGSTIDKIVFSYDNGDRIVTKSTIFTQDMINNYIANYMDSVFEGVTEESDFYTTIQKIKTGFNTLNIASYRNEINALLKLKEVKTLVETVGFDFKTGTPKGAVALGQKIDDAIALGSVIVDNELVNDFISKKIDSYFTDYSDMQDELTQIKLGFNDDIEKYEVEFTALLNLMSISDKANASGFDFKDKEQAKTLGKSIDTALGTVSVGGVDYSSTIVTRELINGYIKNYITDNISLDENSQFGDILETITGTKTGDNFGTGRIDTMTSTYEAEFGYLSQLLIMSDAFTDISISNIKDEVVIDGTNKTTLADQFDGHDGTEGRVAVYDPLRNSYLVGDSLLVAIDGALSSYTASNTDYAEILAEVNYNYEFIKEYITWAGNVNGGLYYTNLINAFDEINDVLTGKLTAEINSVSDLLEEVEEGVTLANYYDNVIYALQGDGVTTYGNLLLLTNGTNKLTKFVLNKVKTMLEEYTSPLDFTQEISYIEDYIEFLDGYIFDEESQTNLDVKYWYLPYGMAEPIYYAFVDATEDVYGIEETTNTHSGIQINTPFTYISEIKNA